MTKIALFQSNTGIEAEANARALVDAIAKAGHPAFYEKNADAILDRIVPMLRPKDIVAVFSNGGFDNIHEKLLERLKELQRYEATKVEALGD